ncbi:MAG: ATP-dependent sacrificial sulfur transferase LarE [Spirochaetaceae bacterium]|jgi:uncharacterized protein|nr:ATP-dependent sacrificial sulfur transferase LarE [Spirochaetaceae bacterium]GMO29398.1 MAG: ATP-dependent sacrificial sulfur transferase LarE [Termitinemataceae bacterium]
MNQKYKDLLELLAAYKKIAVAFSGGVDSSFLCYAAREAVGAENCAAITVVSPMLPESELNSAKKLADFCGIRHILLKESKIDDEVAANPKDRCYFCKKIEFGAIREAAVKIGIETVIDGSNKDDESDYRPGLRALNELKILSPLRRTGFTKAEIRELSRDFNLPTWNKPAYACLASRFPYGEFLDAEKLKRVENAEDYLRSIGFVQFRVRSHANIARIEVAPGERQRFFDEVFLDEVSRRLKSFGFLFVALELEGYKTGSLNVELGTVK